jgi:signal transduction histidine kinase
MKQVRLSARGRLAILYTSLVLAAGVLLSALTYALVRQGLKKRTVVGLQVDPDTPRPMPDARELADIGRRVREETLSQLLTQAAVALALVTVVTAALGWLVAGRVLRPLRTVAATAARLSAENLSERVPVHTPADELASLAATFNTMLDRIQAGVAERDRVLESQRLFTANAAHELRTPLTTMHTAVDVTLHGDPTRDELLAMAEDIRTAVAHSRRTLDGLLALARSQTGTHTTDPVDLADTASQALDTAAEEAARRAIRPRTDLAPAPTRGDPVLLERLVANLVDNALRHNHPGGHVEVTTGTSAGDAFIRVANTGPRIPRDQAEGLLEPFVRGSGVRTRHHGGAGLGLSIVRAITQAHHGRLTAHARQSGGLDVTVRFAAHWPAPVGGGPGATGDDTPPRGERTTVATSAQFDTLGPRSTAGEDGATR